MTLKNPFHLISFSVKSFVMYQLLLSDATSVDDIVSYSILNFVNNCKIFPNVKTRKASFYSSGCFTF